MANAIYPLLKQSLLTQSPSVNFASDTIKAALVKISGTGAVSYSAANQYWSSINSGVVGTPVALTSVTETNGQLTSASVTFSSVTSAGNTLGLVLYKDTGTASTSPLIAWFDTGTNIPATPNGGSITITPDATNGWFTL
jgi:hypothetical protein